MARDPCLHPCPVRASSIPVAFSLDTDSGEISSSLSRDMVVKPRINREGASIQQASPHHA